MGKRRALETRDDSSQAVSWPGSWAGGWLPLERELEWWMRPRKIHRTAQQQGNII